MNLSELEALEAEYDRNGYRVRYSPTVDNQEEPQYLPPLAEPGGTREQAEAWHSRLERVARLRGVTAVCVVGPELEPVPVRLEPVVGPADPELQLDKIIWSPAATALTVHSLSREVSETDWQKEHRLRLANLPPAVKQFIKGSEKLDINVLVNPEALVEGLADTDD